MAPPDTTTVQLPALPTELANVVPEAANLPKVEIDRVDLDKLSVRYVVRHVSPGTDGDRSIPFGVQNQRRHAD